MKTQTISLKNSASNVTIAIKMMTKNAVILLLPIFFAVVATLNIQTTVIDGVRNLMSEFTEPFKKVGDNYYLIETNIKRTWLGAVNFCRTKDAHLTSIESEEEWQALSAHLVSQGYTDKQWFWIAANDIDTPLKFFWISTGEPMYITKWSTGQPDNLNGIERCVHLWRKGNEFLMNDWGCQQQAHYICKANPKSYSITVW